MDKWVHRIHRLSLNQLKALEILAESKSGIAEANEAEERLRLKGKALGGVFSSLARQEIDGQYLIEAWGRSAGGRGLRWKLNEKAISKKELGRVVKEVLR